MGSSGAAVGVLGAPNDWTATQDMDLLRLKAGPWVDITHRDYGAVGDGATDDTAAITAAAADANGGVLFFPPDRPYVLSSIALNAIAGLVIHAVGARIIHKSGTSNPMWR